MSSPSDTETAHSHEGSAEEQIRERVTGPHFGFDRYGRLDHHYWRCEACGFESTDPCLRTGCPRCQTDSRSLEDEQGEDSA